MNDQQLQVFLEYTRRFEAMSANLPMFLRLNDPAVGISHGNTDPEFADSFMLRYLNISSEEWYLHDIGLVTDEVWEMWRYSIKQMLHNSVPFGEFWWTKARVKFLRVDGSPTSFVEFVDSTVAEHKGVARSAHAKEHKVRIVQD